MYNFAMSRALRLCIPRAKSYLIAANTNAITAICKAPVTLSSELSCIFNKNCYLSNNQFKLYSSVSSETSEESVSRDKTDLLDTFYDSIDYNAITGEDEVKLKKFKMLLMEVEVQRQEGKYVPSNVTTQQWIDLLELNGRNQRLSQLKFYWLNEMKQLNFKQKQIAKKEKRLEEWKQIQSEMVFQYGFSGNTIFIRIYETTMNVLLNNKLIQAMQFGQNLVIDCGYDKHMNKLESSNCAKQLGLLFSENRVHAEPFNLHFCNVDEESSVMTKLKKLIPTMYEPWFPINVTSKSYLDVFPREKLVYLTPHCREELVTFNYDDIYIIGAMVDKTNNEPLSLAKAKSEGIRMACFPLDRYLSWAVGGKSLALNHCLNIMLDLQTSNSWDLALKHVPRRKLFRPNPQTVAMRNMRRSQLLYSE